MISWSLTILAFSFVDRSLVFLFTLSWHHSDCYKCSSWYQNHCYREYLCDGWSCVENGSYPQTEKSSWNYRKYWFAENWLLVVPNVIHLISTNSRLHVSNIFFWFWIVLLVLFLRAATHIGWVDCDSLERKHPHTVAPDRDVFDFWKGLFSADNPPKDGVLACIQNKSRDKMWNWFF